MKKILLHTSTYQGSEPVSIQDYLRQAAGISGRSQRQFFFKGFIFVNQRKAHSQQQLKSGDMVEVYQPIAESSSLPAENLPIEILFENAEILIANKPTQLAVHPTGNITSGTLANRLAYYLQSQGTSCKVRPVNRLDYGTSGLVIFAKNAQIQARLSEAIQTHRVVRTYYAIVKGIPASESGQIDLPIADRPGQRQVAPRGKPALTKYRVMNTLGEAALLELTLGTGRTHQIRIHLQAIGHPILGDRQYGTSSPFIRRPALHAGKLSFDPALFSWPEVEAPLPEDMVRLVECLKLTGL